MNPIGPFSISELPAVKFDGLYRVLGCLPEDEDSKQFFPHFGSSVRGLDQEQWQEIDLSWRKPTILNQQATSSCVGHSVCGGMQMCWLQSGRAKIEFNPFFPYGLINGGVDRGARISDALKVLISYGICLRDDLPPGAMFQNQFPQKAFESAKNYKLLKAFRCNSFEEICSAISLGFICPLGIMVGDNFPNVDSEGVAPLPAGGGGGHAILGIGLKKSSRYGWVIKILNSWGARFGLSGYCYIRKEHFRRMSPDAFAIQEVSTQDDSVPQVN